MQQSPSRSLNLVPLGGSGQVTNNMYVYETEQDIIIVDCGIGFPDEAVPGVDLTIPDITYLKGKEHLIRGIILSHGHEDHIGGLSFIVPQLGEKIPIYASRLTAGFIKEKFKEFQLNTSHINVVGDRQPLQLGSFEVKFIPVTHSVPDTKHLLIKTPFGTIYHGSDFKFDWTPIGDSPPDVQSITKAGAEGITLLLSDCLRSERPGYSLSEAIIEDSFEREFRNVEGRVVITTMSSSIARIQQALWVAKRNNRKVAFIGYSIERNVKVASQLGFLKIPPRLVVDKRKVDTLPSHNVCLIVAGSQGQMSSSLTRLAENEYRNLELKPSDKVIFSADPIPGNEKNVNRVIDLLSKRGIAVSYSDIASDLHVSGHASSRELMMLIAMTRPQYVMPIGGTYKHMVQYQKLAQKMHLPKDRILMPEDEIITLHQGGKITLGSPLKLRTVYVEGSEINASEQKLEDRKLMFQEGAVVILITLPTVNNPSFDIDLIPKGITKTITPTLSLAIKQELLRSLRTEDKTRDRMYIKDKVAKQANRLFVAKLHNNPLVIPVVIEG